ncbi:MAG: hypothetical protein AAB606_01185 [Patescibacteria group bacterium]
MPEIQKKLVLADIYEAFGDRCPPELKVRENRSKPADLGIGKNELMSACGEAGAKASALFDGVSKGDPSKKIQDPGIGRGIAWRSKFVFVFCESSGHRYTFGILGRGLF